VIPFSYGFGTVFNYGSGSGRTGYGSGKNYGFYSSGSSTLILSITDKEYRYGTFYVHYTECIRDKFSVVSDPGQITDPDFFGSVHIY